jgi:ABC-type taurine transport system substrate-binding protein
MPLKNKFQQERPWAILGWTRKQWKAQKMWKKAGVTEDKMIQLLQSLDYSTIQEMKDHAMAELLTEKAFGSEE